MPDGAFEVQGLIRVKLSRRRRKYTLPADIPQRVDGQPSVKGASHLIPNRPQEFVENFYSILTRSTS